MWHDRWSWLDADNTTDDHPQSRRNNDNSIDRHWGTGLEAPSADLENAYRLASVPKRLPPATTWQERVSRWSHIRRTPVFLERAEVRAGRRGEQVTRRWIGQQLRTNMGTVFGGKRVPRDMTAASMGRYEIDLVVVTPRRVVALETKNWSGRLRLDDGRWVHERRDGTVKVFGDLIAHNRNKLRALRDYLAQSGISLPLARFHQALIFDNPNLNLDARIAAHPAVIEGRDVGLLFGRPTGSMAYTLARIIERCAGSDGAQVWAEHVLDIITPGQKQAVCAALSRLRTWDTLTLRGGRVLQGDLYWLRVGDETFDAASLAPATTVDLCWRRDIWGLVPILLADGAFGRMGDALLADSAGGRRGERVLDVDDCLYFHEVGQPQPSVITLSAVDRIQVG